MTKGVEPVDATDVQIVRILHANGRATQEQIARAVNLSRPAVHERIKRLEQQGAIRGYRALVDWPALGQPMAAFIWVRTAGVRCAETGARLMALSGETGVVEECHRVTGEWCMLLKVRAASALALQDLIDRMREVPGVQATTTHMVLSTLSEHETDGGDAA